MFFALATLTVVLAIVAGALLYIGLHRRVWPILLAGVPFVVGAGVCFLFAYRNIPEALSREFAEHSMEIATAMMLCAIAASLVSVIGLPALGGSRGRTGY